VTEGARAAAAPAAGPGGTALPDVRLPLGALVAYSLPALGVGASFFLVTLYLIKFATDVLLIAPAVMGLLFGLSRVWDAISDPLAGYYSDRTRSRFGRRRSWMLASALPLAVTLLMLWSPPRALEGRGLAIWMGAALFLFMTATTIFAVPHEALGAELSKSYHDRTRIFGVKFAIQSVGTFVAIGALSLLSTQGVVVGEVEREGLRGTATWLALAMGGGTLALIVFSVLRLRERDEYQGRGGTRIWRAFGDVLRNPHAALLLVVFLIENLGVATIGMLVPYVTQYIVKDPGLMSRVLLLYIAPAILFVPVWIRVSRVIGKKTLWVFSMSAMTVAFGGMFFVGEGDGTLISILGLIAGVGGGCGAVVGPSIKADVIDYDEYLTGERKEGSYFAVWNFVRKSAYGVTAMLTGFVLQASGFVPNVEQSEQTKTAMLVLIGLFPGVCYGLGTLLFLRFRLDEKEYARIRWELEARRVGSGTGSS
jgi:GPH family glycoside/pentoside/hexuronide:cation symporter